MTPLARSLAPAEVFHPSVFIREEMRARRWSRATLARHMPGDYIVNRLAIDLYLEIGPREPNLRLDPEYFAGAFGVAPEFFRNLEAAWLAGQGAAP
jgi:hypothetical protein